MSVELINDHHFDVITTFDPYICWKCGRIVTTLLHDDDNTKRKMLNERFDNYDEDIRVQFCCKCDDPDGEVDSWWCLPASMLWCNNSDAISRAYTETIVPHDIPLRNLPLPILCEYSDTSYTNRSIDIRKHLGIPYDMLLE